MPKRDPELEEFEAALLRSVEQAMSGKHAHVHTPEEIAARRRGRPTGTVAAVRKSATTIRFDEEVLAAFRATGRGWQTRMNNALKDWLKTHSPG